MLPRYGFLLMTTEAWDTEGDNDPFDLDSDSVPL